MNFMVDDGGLCDPIGDAGDLFDHIDDLLDFPGSGDDVLGIGMGIVSVDDPPELSTFPPPPLHVNGGSILFARAGGYLSGHVDAAGGGDLSGNVDAVQVHSLRDDEQKLSPCDEVDMVQLEWMSNFFDESNNTSSFSLHHSDNSILIPNPAAVAAANASKSTTTAIIKAKVKANGDCNVNEGDRCFRTPSPKSVLGSGGAYSSSTFSSSSSSSSSTSCSADGVGDVIDNERRVLTLRVHGRPRSKRPRPRATVTFVPPPALEPLSLLSDPESFDESCPPPAVPLKKKKKMKHPQQQQFHPSDGDEESGSPPPQPVRKCMHCEITKTPQWRAGPMGPKTLCNACGVRYKSGRLFPEYRPAASPTFVTSLHSNSHKKVVEMRLKATSKSTAASAGVAQRISSCDLLEYLRRRE